MAAESERQAQEAQEEHARMRREKASKQHAYNQELQAQMALDSDKRRHLFRMSEKERALNRQVQRTAAHCDTLQHTAHCNTLQHNASHYITLQHATYYLFRFSEKERALNRKV